MREMLEKLIQISTKLNQENINCIDFIQCIFGLNDTDMQVLKSIPQNTGININDISKSIKKDRSTVHRSLEKLIMCKICYKERKSGIQRGFIDYYFTISEDELINIAEDNLDTCYVTIKTMLQGLKKNDKIDITQE
jgi:predicted transcriptional regulator